MTSPKQPSPTVAELMRLNEVVPRHEIEAFYYLEADLLDRHEFGTWIGLFSDDIHYVVSPRPNVVERQVRNAEAAVLPFIDDRLDGLKARTARLADPAAWAELPRSRTRRLIGNVLVRKVEDGGFAEVQCNFAVYRSRRSDQEHVFFGSRVDRIDLSSANEWKIDKRHVILDQSVLKAHNLSLLF